jgi:hypothetical protein
MRWGYWQADALHDISLHFGSDLFVFILDAGEFALRLPSTVRMFGG